MGQATPATAGLRGLDCNEPIGSATAKALFDHGYLFVVRYVAREHPHANDLSAEELTRLTAAGLAVMAVQHVESESAWIPTADKGRRYGATAARIASDVGLAPGTTVWCDLEGVSTSVVDADINAYCREWFAACAAGGYEPGLYVGWRAGLDAHQLYTLPFEHYWGAYNLNADQAPATRGVQMKQHTAHAGDLPVGVDLGIDVDTIDGDALGGFPTLHTE